MHLNELRHSLQNAQVLQKATGAMRILSMSLHSAMRKKYKQQESFYTVLKKGLEEFVFLNDSNIIDENMPSIKTLFVFIGSTGGLCGAYNTLIAKRYEKIKHMAKSKDCIVIGKKLFSLLKVPSESLFSIVHKLSHNNFDLIQKDLFEYAASYDVLTIVYVLSKSLFIQEVVQESIVFDVKNDYQQTLINNQDKSLHYYTADAVAVEKAKKMLLEIQCQKILISALESKYAMRFLAMDNAWKNANDIISQKKIMYNKKRQEIINNQLLDLTAGRFALL